MATFGHRLLVWAWDALNACMGGSATAGCALFAGLAIGAHDFTLRQIVAVMIGGALPSLFMYMREHRLPEIDETPKA
jgi:hypothetical protein